MADASKLDIGPCDVSLNGIDLGYTEGGVMFKYEPSSVQMKADQLGDTPLDFALLGENVEVECNLAEITEANVAFAMTNATKTTSGGDTMVGFGATPGTLYSSRTNVGQLVLHPSSRSAGDKSHDVTLYKVVVDSAIELSFTADTQKVLKVTFKALIDGNKPAGKQLGHYGTHIS